MRFRPHQGINKFNNLDLVYNIEGAEKVGFRPHQGINKFNSNNSILLKIIVLTCFRPHQGINKFNKTNIKLEIPTKG